MIISDWLNFRRRNGSPLLEFYRRRSGDDSAPRWSAPEDGESTISPCGILRGSRFARGGYDGPVVPPRHRREKSAISATESSWSFVRDVNRRLPAYRQTETTGGARPPRRPRGVDFPGPSSVHSIVARCNLVAIRCETSPRVSAAPDASRYACSGPGRNDQSASDDRLGFGELDADSVRQCLVTGRGDGFVLYGIAL